MHTRFVFNDIFEYSPGGSTARRIAAGPSQKSFKSYKFWNPNFHDVGGNGEERRGEGGKYKPVLGGKGR